ncbi:hypothetical protein D3C72_2131830 [compost metagenome]
MQHALRPDFSRPHVAHYRIMRVRIALPGYRPTMLHLCLEGSEKLGDGDVTGILQQP